MDGGLRDPVFQGKLEAMNRRQFAFFFFGSATRATGRGTGRTP